VSELFFLMRNSSMDFTEQMKPAQFKEFRELVVGSILATDLDNHADDLTAFRTLSGKEESIAIFRWLLPFVALPRSFVISVVVCV
jgi:hypothetical protein